VTFLIFMNCIFLGMYDPSQPEDTTANRVSAASEHVLIILFTMEVVIKTVAYGFVMPKAAYIHDSWNKIDLLVVVLGLLNYVPGMDNGTSVLRTVRLLRPLRTISSNPGLRISCTALIESLPSLVDVFSLWTFCFVIFGIVGMQFWQGTFHKHCVPEDNLLTTESHMETTCGHTGCEEGFVCTSTITGWNNETISLRNPNYGTTSFDNFWWTYIVLFATMTKEGWVQFNDLSAQVSGDIAVAYYVALVWFGSFFVVNLATAVVFANFTRLATREQEVKAMQEEADRKHGIVHKRSKSFVEEKLENLSKKVADEGPAEPKSVHPFRQFLLNVVENQAFQFLVITVIGFNTVALACEYDGMSQPMEDVLSTLNLIFTLFFGLECIMKILAYGFFSYIKVMANAFDFFIVLVSIIELVVPEGAGPQGISVLRTFRLLRVLKLFKSWESIRVLMENVTASLTSIANFAIIASIILFIFSLMGVQFFGDNLCEEHVCSDPSVGLEQLCTGMWIPPGEEMMEARVWSCETKPNGNFRNIFWAFLSVFQCFTGENWHILLYQSIGATSWVASIYYIALMLIGHYILMNLFLASIVHNVVESTGAKGAPRDAESRRRLKEHMAKQKVTREQRRAVTLTKTFMSHTASEVAQAIRGEELASTPKSKSMPNLHDVGPDAIYSTDPDPIVSKSEQLEKVQDAFVKGSGPVAEASMFSPREPSLMHMADNLEAAAEDSRETLECVSITESDCEPCLKERPAGTPPPITGWPSGGESQSHTQGQAVCEGFEEEGESQGNGHTAEDEDDGAVVNLNEEDHMSLYIFAPENPIRVKAYVIANSKVFDNFIIACILISSLTLAIENPHKKELTDLGRALKIIDIVFTVIFLLEMVLKIIAYGFVTPLKGAYGYSYIRDSWNKLDFLIVIISLLSLGLDSPQLKALKALRTLRGLRPLRLLTHNEGMKRVVSTLMSIIPAIANIIVLVIIAWLIFAILGVQLFSGKLSECNDPDIEWKVGFGPAGDGSDECIGFFAGGDDGEMIAREWSSERPHFDHTGEALLTLFELATLEDWDAIMYKGMAAREVGQSMKAQAHPEYCLYFLFYIIVGALFVMNIMISAVVNHFLRMKDTGASGFLTKGQTDWLDAQKSMMSERPEIVPLPPTEKWRLQIYKVCVDPRFDYFIMSIIFLNIFVMLLVHYEESPTFTTISEWVNNIFSAIFLLECIAKITAYNFRQYWVDFWNKFDFIIVTLSVVSFVIARLGGKLGFNPTMIRVFRVFRTARVLRMIRTAKGLRMLLRTFILSLPSLWNVGSLVFMSFFIFAILGIYLLGDAPRGDTINGSVNFETFGRAMFVLLRSCTGENWTEIFHAYMSEGYPIVVPYYLAFLLLNYFVLLNLFIAVILENFGQANKLEDSVLTPSDFAFFTEVWKEFDPQATQTINSSKVELILKKVPPPLGFKGLPLPTSKLMNILQEMNLADHGPDSIIHYVELLSALAYRVSGEVLPDELENKTKLQYERAFPKLKTLPESNWPIAVIMAAAKIQAAAKGLIARKRQAELLGKEIPSRRVKSWNQAGRLTTNLNGAVGLFKTSGMSSGMSGMSGIASAALLDAANAANAQAQSTPEPQNVAEHFEGIINRKTSSQDDEGTSEGENSSGTADIRGPTKPAWTPRQD